MKSLLIASLVGKTIAKVSRLKGGHGSALPGLIVEKLAPDFLTDALKDLPYGVVVVSGTNGKTTTTKIVVELLRSAGLTVFTNPSGSNFTRGVASSAVSEMKHGKLKADIAVVELDEAYAVQFVRKISPKYSLILNVLRDQLDRFGEIDTTAKMLSEVVAKTTGTAVLNREDPLVSKMSAGRKVFFGYSNKVAKLFPNDDEMYGKKMAKPNFTAAITLEDIDGARTIFNIGDAILKLRGAHNALNAAAALSLVKTILGENFDNQKMLKALESVRPAFGRGESFEINGQPLEMILVKNPSGFRISLASQSDPESEVMIAINDHYADGRDMSWLWDVDFSSLSEVAMVSGIRAYDIALRLTAQGVKVREIDTSLEAALTNFLNKNPNQPKQIYTTYTAMLELRRIVKNKMKAEKIS